MALFLLSLAIMANLPTPMPLSTSSSVPIRYAYSQSDATVLCQFEGTPGRASSMRVVVRKLIAGSLDLPAYIQIPGLQIPITADAAGEASITSDRILFLARKGSSANGAAYVTVPWTLGVLNDRRDGWRDSYSNAEQSAIIEYGAPFPSADQPWRSLRRAIPPAHTIKWAIACMQDPDLQMLGITELWFGSPASRAQSALLGVHSIAESLSAEDERQLIEILPKLGSLNLKVKVLESLEPRKSELLDRALSSLLMETKHESREEGPDRNAVQGLVALGARRTGRASLQVRAAKVRDLEPSSFTALCEDIVDSLNVAAEEVARVPPEKAIGRLDDDN